ncbi:unnamed protein product [Rangifer tarandus platyrhynchus]|uniref:Uncharacterized protein n=2 Tax=Rangifer tarandus platyrhynchus TaxID=3082113 RepID=A0ACB0EDS5_RANTA|nr:unnamed protein product [Rangifer tarandus platyrhynchus]CAI9698478.1 unnamed protein product [Rangifer tarandus platyrhynchus]
MSRTTFWSKEAPICNLGMSRGILGECVYAGEKFKAGLPSYERSPESRSGLDRKGARVPSVPAALLRRSRRASAWRAVGPSAPRPQFPPNPREPVLKLGQGTSPGAQGESAALAGPQRVQALRGGASGRAWCGGRAVGVGRAPEAGGGPAGWQVGAAGGSRGGGGGGSKWLGRAHFLPAPSASEPARVL